MIEAAVTFKFFQFSQRCVHCSVSVVNSKSSGIWQQNIVNRCDISAQGNGNPLRCDFKKIWYRPKLGRIRRIPKSLLFFFFENDVLVLKISHQFSCEPVINHPAITVNMQIFITSNKWCIFVTGTSNEMQDSISHKPLCILLAILVSFYRYNVSCSYYILICLSTRCRKP